ncbi:MAG: EAL domain-containing protein [Candidatus Eremiobacteraeota bacterium]|nr:EAL domain-containing protein [Candidatus Eremiobacteraeota bacterium]MBV8644699.1 EAL domain-containing protein [Candidatus Eremiobacteraeota bacterium]
MDYDSSKKQTVLVVDDDAVIRLLAREALEPEGFTIEEAIDGVTALATARRIVPDLILLDVQMPAKNGFDVCADVRADPLLAHVPILIATGLDDVESIERAYRLGATNFIEKPISWNTLAYDVRYAIRNAELEAELRVAHASAQERLEQLKSENAERRRAEGALRESEVRFRRLFETAKDGILLLDYATERIADVNPALLEMIGYQRSDLLGERLVDVAPFNDVPDCRTVLDELRAEKRVRADQWRLATRDGFTLDVEFIGNVYEADGGARVMQCNVRDITERIETEARMRYMALHDALTGLPNRALLQDHLSQAITAARRNKQKIAVLMLDLDNFKEVNDSLGHHVGDDLLETTAKRLRKCLRESDIVARLGGDEFVVTLMDVADARHVEVVAHKILKALAQPYDLEGREVQVGTSIGISLYPNDGEDAGALLRAADTAMYDAKGSGRGTFRCFTPALNDAAQRRLVLANDIRHACTRGEFVVFYQPQVSLESGNIVGVEALLRWRHPEQGLVAPSTFIPLLEETGLIVEIGEWVLRTACAQSVAWQNEGLPPMRVAVNLSARQFYRGDIVRTVAQALEESGLEPHLLELELTESLTLDDTDATIRIMHDLKMLGVSLSLDDFGTGWSSLSYLRRFPLDRIKIDRSFMRDVATHTGASTIVQSIMHLAQKLGIQCIAEGLETPDQLGYLDDQMCPEVQGFLFAPALPASELAAMLQSPQPLETWQGAA